MPQIENWPQTVGEFELLIEATQDELIRFAFYRLANRDDAEDIVQDVYVEAYRDRAKRRHVTRVRPYLFRMVGNRCVDLLRARSRQTGHSVGDENVPVGEDGFSLVAARQEARSLARSLDSLPPKEAEVIRLRVFADLLFSEIAEVVGSPVPTVKSRFRYGLSKLRRLLVPEEVRNELPRSY